MTSGEIMQGIYSEMNAKTDMQKNLCSELTFLVLSCVSNETGYTHDRKVELRKAVYEERYGSVEEKVLSIAGYWSNDLEDIAIEELKYSTPFKFLLEYLNGKEIISGVVLK